MPNWCDCKIRIRGSKRSVDEFIKIIGNDYSYMSLPPKVDGYHFFRVFEHQVTRYENTIGLVYTAEINATCAWSVYCCMCPGPFTYYDEVKAEIPPEYFYGTNLIMESKRLQLEIEVFSQELGMMFSEHYRLIDGITINNEEFPIQDYFYLEQDTYAEYLKEWGEDDRIHNEEEYQALKSQADEYGNVIIGKHDDTYTMPDKPNYMVNLVLYKEVKCNETRSEKQIRPPYTEDDL